MTGLEYTAYDGYGVSVMTSIPPTGTLIVVDDGIMDSRVPRTVMTADEKTSVLSLLVAVTVAFPGAT